MQYAMLSYVVRIVACILALGVGVYVYLIGANKCMKSNLFSIGRCASSDDDDDDDHTNESDLLEQFIEFIQFQALVKQLSRKSI